jgi:hypothetical protein
LFNGGRKGHAPRTESEINRGRCLAVITAATLLHDGARSAAVDRTLRSAAVLAVCRSLGCQRCAPALRSPGRSPPRRGRACLPGPSRPHSSMQTGQSSGRGGPSFVSPTFQTARVARGRAGQQCCQLGLQRPDGETAAAGRLTRRRDRAAFR